MNTLETKKTEVAKITKPLCPDLSQIETQIVKASAQLKVKQCKKVTLAEVIDSAVATCLITLGTDRKKFSENDLFLVKKEVVNDIFTNFNTLTFDEIRIAFHLGSRGQYKTKPDEVVYFSVATVYNWLKSYIAQTKREAMQKQARFEQDKYESKKPTEEEKRRLGDFFLKEYIIKPYNHYRETGEYLFDNRGNVIYTTLDKLKAIPFNLERKRSIFERAKQIIIAQMEQFPGPDTRNRLNHIKEGKGPGHEEVVSKSKDIALCDFFREMKEQGMDLQDWIEMRRQ